MCAKAGKPSAVRTRCMAPPTLSLRKTHLCHVPVVKCLSLAFFVHSLHTFRCFCFICFCWLGVVLSGILIIVLTLSGPTDWILHYIKTTFTIFFCLFTAIVYVLRFPVGSLLMFVFTYLKLQVISGHLS